MTWHDEKRYAVLILHHQSSALSRSFAESFG